MKRLVLLLGMLGFGLTIAFAQTTVSGSVKDEAGEPLEGVAVLVKGTTIGMFTDEQGMYKIEVPSSAASDASLLFTYVGRKTVDEAINGRSTINVTLEPDYLQVDEVLVTAVGLETNRRTLGYSVQNVEADEIVNSRETNLVNALNSKVAGVVVNSASGSPGAAASIRIRGAVSVGRSNSPLFVVDGVPIDNSSSGNGVGGVDNTNRAIDINPNDIASLTVLKGAAATALYGIRAANGAVIITTKAGKAGKPKVTVSASYTADEVNKLNERQSTFAQGRPGAYRGPELLEGFSWGPAISELEYDGATDYLFDRNGALVPTGTGNGAPAQAYDPYTFFVTGNTVDLNASVSGGNENLNYYISGGTLQSNGVVPNATFGRTTFKVRTEAKLTRKLTAGMSANFVNSGGNRIQRGSNLRGVMLGLLRNTPTFDIGNGLEGREAADNVDTYVAADGTQRSYRNGIYDNPYWVANRNATVDEVNRIIGYASLKYEFTPWLSAIYKLGIDMFTDRRNGAIDIVPNWNPGSVFMSTRYSSDINSDLLLQFNKNISSDLNINATVGHNFFSSRFRNMNTDGTGLASPGFYNIANAATVQAFETIAQRDLVGVFGTATISYGDYLFVNLSARNDWSSSLPEGGNSIFYPAASVGFAFTELLGMRDNPILPYGKIRLSWGQVGNDAPIYATDNYYNAAQSGGDGFIDPITYPAFGLNAFELSTVLGNANLRPETTTTWEVGAELKFLQGRIGLDFTYYNSTSVDQVISVSLPAPTGYTSIVQNAGVITNTGIEAILDITPVRTRDFEWTITTNFTAYENTVDSLAPGIDNIFLAGFTSTSSRAFVGEPYGALFGTAFQKDDNGNTIIGADGFPLRDPNSRVIGDPNPDWLMGIRNTFTFKGLSLSALLDIRQGGDMWCGTCGVIDYFGTSGQTGDLRGTTTVFEGVTEDGNVNTQEVAYADEAGGLGAIYWVRYGFGGLTEMSVYETSWVRLRELTLSYSLPKSMISSAGLGDVTVSLSGRNLWLSTQYPGIDPENNLTGASNGFGLDYFGMPNTRSYGANIRLTF